MARGDRAITHALRARLILGLNLAGQSFAPRTLTGRLAGAVQASVLAPLRGRYLVQLPAASAAMLVLTPATGRR